MKRNIFITIGGQVIIQAIGLITGILVARNLGPEGRGQLAVIIAWASAITCIGDLGLPVAYAYTTAKMPERSRWLIGNMIIVVPLQWLLLVGIGSYVLPVALSGHGDLLLHLAFLYLCAYLPLNYVTRYINAIQQGFGNYLRFNSVRICVPVTYMLGLIVLWFLGRFNLVSVLWINLFSNIATLLLALVLTLPTIFQGNFTYRSFKFDYYLLIKNLRYGLSAHIGTLQPFTNLHLDILILSTLITSEELGYYVVALAAAQILNAQGNAVGQVILPEIAKLKDFTDKKNLILSTGFSAVIVSGVIATISFVWAKPLLRIVYGVSFLPAAPILRVLVLGAVIGILYRIIADGLRGMGYPFSSTISEVVGSFGGIIGMVMFVPKYGALGAAYSMMVGSMLSLFVVAFMLVKRLQIIKSSQVFIDYIRKSDIEPKLPL